MGVVFMAQRGTQLAALKVVRDSYLDDANARARFKREVNTLRRVSGPFVAAIIDADMDANPAWIASEFVEGPDLKAHVDVHGAMQPAQWELLAGGLLLALAAVHAAGVVHRDIKPANVLLAKDGPKLIDFGIAQAGDGTVLTTTGLAVGSPAWMAPEQVGAKVAGPAADVFCVGSVLLFAATGRAPWGTGSIAEVMRLIAVAQPDLRGLSERQQRLLSGLLEKNPAMRPSAAQAAQLLTDTTSVAGATQVVETGWAGGKLGGGWTPPSPPSSGGTWRRRLNIFLLVLLITVGVGMISFAGVTIAILDGNRNGQGTLIWPNGTTYTGEFKDGKRYGQGTMNYASGETYTGGWRDGNLNGQGTLIWPNGDEYIGEFKDSKRNGQGFMTFANGSTYDGAYKDNKRSGYGTLTYYFGHTYAGEWRGDERHGQGTYTDANGSTYTGEYMIDARNGQGTYIDANGYTYSGEWKDGKIIGQVTVTYANGTTYTGEWKDGDVVPGSWR